MAATIPDDIKRAIDAYLASLTLGGTEEFRRTDAEKLAQLAQHLKPFTEAERLSFIKTGLLEKNPFVALSVAELCLESKKSFDSLIREGFPYVNSTQIKFWIKHSLRYVDESELLGYIDELSSSPLIRSLAKNYCRKFTRPNLAKEQA